MRKKLTLPALFRKTKEHNIIVTSSITGGP